MIKQTVKFIFAIILCSIIGTCCIASEQVKTLSAGISLNEQVPISLMGTWRVVSVLENTDSPANFKKSGVDIWNLSKSGDVITLSNPFTGANASIKVNYVNKNTVKFSKEGSYDNQKLTDTVEITLNGDKFSGVNILVLKNSENSVAKNAIYILRGEKISGTSILER